MSDSAKHKLLVLDDSDLIRKALLMLLSESGFDVRTAASVAEFETLLAHWWPDTILTDVQMPDMRGDDLCRRLKGRLLVRVILFSNLPHERLAELAKTSGADGCISKLSGLANLPSALNEILDQLESPALEGGPSDKA